MSTQKPKSKYNCTQAELYAIATILYNSFQQFLTDFTNFKSVYTPAYYTDKLQELNVTKSLPDLQQRDEPVELARKELKKKAKDCLKAWQALKSYITGTFDEDEWKLMLESAGADYYSKASNRNWEILLQMMESGMEFINEHSIEMTNANMMPINFPSDFNTLKIEVLALYEDFKEKEQKFKQNTAAKINANNAVFDSIMVIMKDGQKIYKEDAAVKDRFVFKKVKALVTPPSSSVKTFEGEALATQAVEVVLTDVNLDVAGTRLSFLNTGAVPAAPALVFYFAATPGELPSASGTNSFYVVAGDSVVNLTPTQAGYSIEKPHLLVYNSSNDSGSYKVEARK
jgi:hypothetical protein